MIGIRTSEYNAKNEKGAAVKDKDYTHIDETLTF